jgi:hypothetical protein
MIAYLMIDGSICFLSGLTSPKISSVSSPKVSGMNMFLYSKSVMNALCSSFAFYQKAQIPHRVNKPKTSESRTPST